MSAHSASDVIVLGGGTVGLAAAAALAAQGFHVVLVERVSALPQLAAITPELPIDARVYALSEGSIRFLRRLGAWPAAFAQRTAPYRAMQVWQNAPEHALKFAAASPDAALGCIAEHGALNAALASALPEGVQLCLGRTAEDWQLEEGAVALTLSDGSRLQGKLLVIADGPSSPWPERLGLQPLGWGYEQRAIICHARFAASHGDTSRQRFLPSGPLALLPLADGRSSIVWSCPEDMAEELLALDDSAFALRLATAAQQVLGPVLALTPRQSFPLQLKRLHTPVAEAAVILGDAAHVIHPLAGQGVNLGLADAECLASTLAAARDAGRSWWSLRTLQAHARTRAPEVDEMLALTDGLHRAFTQGGGRLARWLGAAMPMLNQVPGATQALASRAGR